MRACMYVCMMYDSRCQTQCASGPPPPASSCMYVHIIRVHACAYACMYVLPQGEVHWRGNSSVMGTREGLPYTVAEEEKTILLQLLADMALMRLTEPTKLFSQQDTGSRTEPSMSQSQMSKEPNLCHQTFHVKGDLLMLAYLTRLQLSDPRSG